MSVFIAAASYVFWPALAGVLAVAGRAIVEHVGPRA